MILEVCCGCRASVDAAVLGGAQRIELCSHLELDGLTPAWGDLQYARSKYPFLKIHVLIRPRGGNFVYSAAEVAAMCADIDTALSFGADGIVIGALTASGGIDIPVMEAMMESVSNFDLLGTLCHSATDDNLLGRRVSVTFHRAFDVCRDPFEALSQIISLGCSRILTSGQAATAIEGASMIRSLQEKAGSRLTILAGGGVTPTNVTSLVRLSGCREVHASASALVDGRKVTQASTVAAILEAL